MKHKTQLPMLIGVFSIIAIFLMAQDCDKAKDKKKTDDLTIAFSGATTVTKVAAVAGNGNKEYYTVPALAGTFSVDVTAKSKDTSGISIEIDAPETAKSGLAANQQPTVAGKVVTLKNHNGFFYIIATKVAKGDYAKTTKKIIVAQGAVPIPTAAIVPNKELFNEGRGAAAGTYTAAMGGFVGTGANADNIIRHTSAVDTDPSRIDKTIIVKAKVDYTKLPPEAPRPTSVYVYDLGTTGRGYATVADRIDGRTGTVTLDDSVTAGHSINVRVSAAAAAPYAALAPQDLYKIALP